MTRSIFGDVTAFEQRLGLPHGFYDRLIKEDDWSFVIKLNSLFEGACTHILAMRLHSPELIEPLAHLDFAHSKCGKITMLKTLNAISPEHFSVLRSLAELRNKLVHNVANVGFTFKAYVASLDKNQLKELIKAYGHGVADTIEVRGTTIPRDKFVTQNPKLALWLTSAELLACLHLEHEVAELRLQKTALDKYFNLALIQPNMPVGADETEPCTQPDRPTASCGKLAPH